jgi:hypothetical protein
VDVEYFISGITHKPNALKFWVKTWYPTQLCSCSQTNLDNPPVAPTWPNTTSFHRCYLHLELWPTTSISEHSFHRSTSVCLPLSSFLFSSNKLLSLVWNRRYIHFIFWPPSRNIPFTNPPHCEFHYSLPVNSKLCSIQT